MKIRQGFVSNSSSTSFSIYGIQGDSDDLLALINKNLGTDYTYLTEVEGSDNPAVKQLEFISGDEYGYIGRSWSSINQNETGGQFQASVERNLTVLLGKKGAKTVEGITESVYN